MLKASPSIGEMWPSMSRVECHSENELPPEEASLQSEILFFGAFFLYDRKKVARV
jgi:hypothetical protein